MGEGIRLFLGIPSEGRLAGPSSKVMPVPSNASSRWIRSSKSPSCHLPLQIWKCRDKRSIRDRDIKSREAVSLPLAYLS